MRELYRWRWSIATIWFTAVFLLILARFWDYWSTLDMNNRGKGRT